MQQSILGEYISIGKETKQNNSQTQPRRLKNTELKLDWKTPPFLGLLKHPRPPPFFLFNVFIAFLLLASPGRIGYAPPKKWAIEQKWCHPGNAVSRTEPTKNPCKPSVGLGQSPPKPTSATFSPRESNGVANTKQKEEMTGAWKKRMPNAPLFSCYASGKS